MRRTLWHNGGEAFWLGAEGAGADKTGVRAMKRFVLPLVVGLVLAGAGLLVLRLRAPHARPVAAWLPDTAILFEDMPNLHRTAQRWPATALAQIIREPEVQAFLARPLAEIPRRANLENRLAQALRIDPTQFFVAVTDWSGNGGEPPKAIAGFSYAGSKQEVEALIDELRKEAQKEWPQGKSDIESYGGGEIETFSTPGFSAALAHRGRWLFLATDTALLKATLDRYEGTPGMGQSLADLPAFKSTLQHLPGAPDNIFFLRPGQLADRVAGFALMLNPTADMRGMDNVRRIEALGVALKLDGEVMRDATYVMKPGEPGDEGRLAKDALRLSTPDTIVAANGRVEKLDGTQWPDPKSDPSGVLQLLESYMKVFMDQGLGMEQVGQAFGPESGFLLDWPAGAVIPTPLAMVDVRDAAKARKFLDTLATLPIAAGISFTHEESGGIALYSLPPTGIGLFPLQVTLGLSGKCVIGGLNIDAVKQAAKRWDSGKTGLDGSVPYTKAVGLVGESTMSFTYVDTKAVFERIYGLFRGVASMGLVPHLSDYVDVSKLPAPETISRHLVPIVASGAAKGGGVLMESAGPVSMTQAGVIAAISAGAMAIPLLEQAIKGQSAGPGQIPFTRPWNRGGSVNQPGGMGLPAAPLIPPGPSLPAASASGSAGSQ